MRRWANPRMKRHGIVGKFSSRKSFISIADCNPNLCQTIIGSCALL